MPGDLPPLGHQGQLLSRQGQGKGLPIEPNRTALDRQLTLNGLQQGAFAGAVGAHQGGERAGLERKSHAVESQLAAAAHPQLTHLKRHATPSVQPQT